MDIAVGSSLSLKIEDEPLGAPLQELENCLEIPWRRHHKTRRKRT